MPPLGNEGRVGRTFPGVPRDGRLAIPEPPGLGEGRATPPPDGLNPPPPAGRLGLGRVLGREAFPMDGLLPPLGCGALGRGEGRAPPPDGRPPPAPTCPMEGLAPPPPPRPPPPP